MEDESCNRVAGQTEWDTVGRWETQWAKEVNAEQSNKRSPTVTQQAAHDEQGNALLIQQLLQGLSPSLWLNSGTALADRGRHSLFLVLLDGTLGQRQSDLLEFALRFGQHGRCGCVHKLLRDGFDAFFFFCDGLAFQDTVIGNLVVHVDGGETMP